MPTCEVCSTHCLNLSAHQGGKARYGCEDHLKRLHERKPEYARGIAERHGMVDALPEGQDDPADPDDDGSESDMPDQEEDFEVKEVPSKEDENGGEDDSNDSEDNWESIENYKEKDAFDYEKAKQDGYEEINLEEGKLR